MTDVGVALICGFVFGFVIGAMFIVLMVASYVVEDQSKDKRRKRR